MSHAFYKTKYFEETGPGETEGRVLYAHHNHTSCIITMYNQDFKPILCVDMSRNNKFDAMKRLYEPDSIVEAMHPEDEKFLSLTDEEYQKLRRL